MPISIYKIGRVPGAVIEKKGRNYLEKHGVSVCYIVIYVYIYIYTVIERVPRSVIEKRGRNYLEKIYWWWEVVAVKCYLFDDHCRRIRWIRVQIFPRDDAIHRHAKQIVCDATAIRQMPHDVILIPAVLYVPMR